MSHPLSGGDADMPDVGNSGRSSSCKTGAAGMMPPNPVRGGSGSLTSFNPAGVGSFALGNRPNRVGPTRRPLINLGTVNSSTMKGPRGLASKYRGRQGRTAKN
jgi:hypothetical protein